MGSVPKSIQISRTIFGTIVNRYFVPFMVQLRSNEGQPNFNKACCKSYNKHKGALTARRDGTPIQPIPKGEMKNV